MKAKRKADDRALEARNKAFIAEYKAKHPCIECGEPDIRCLDFDHRDRRDKLRTVSYMVKMRWAIRRIEAEIRKCDVRCANCHRKRSHDGKHHLPVEIQ